MAQTFWKRIRRRRRTNNVLPVSKSWPKAKSSWILDQVPVECNFNSASRSLFCCCCWLAFRNCVPRTLSVAISRLIENSICSRERALNYFFFRFIDLLSPSNGELFHSTGVSFICAHLKETRRRSSFDILNTTLTMLLPFRAPLDVAKHSGIKSRSPSDVIWMPIPFCTRQQKKNLKRNRYQCRRIEVTVVVEKNVTLNRSRLVVMQILPSCKNFHPTVFQMKILIW